MQYGGGRGAPGPPAWAGKEGVLDLLVTENIFYGRDAQVLGVYSHPNGPAQQCRGAASLGPPFTFSNLLCPLLTLNAPGLPHLRPQRLGA